ncbi:MAG: DUF2905 domain-containing protein [Saprospiraceae bacterium]
MNQDTARWIIVLGLLLVAGGLLYFCFGKYLHWMGRLPGDIRIQKENFSFYFPITTMIILSLLFNLLIRLIRFWVKS